MHIADKYARAVNSSNLRGSSLDETDVDILGAYALASNLDPLGAALSRWYVGDSKALKLLVDILADKITAQFPGRISMAHAAQVAANVLAWHQDPACKTCDGLGKELIQGSPTLSDRDCKACKGTGQSLLSKRIHKDKHKFAEWALAQVQLAQSSAGSIAMRFLRPREAA